MKKLKIEISREDHDVKVFVDDQQILLIQEISIKASVNNSAPEVIIVFPNFVDESAYSWSDNLAKAVSDNVELLKEFPQVSISYKKL